MKTIKKHCPQDFVFISTDILADDVCSKTPDIIKERLIMWKFLEQKILQHVPHDSLQNLMNELGEQLNETENEKRNVITSFSG